MRGIRKNDNDYKSIVANRIIGLLVFVAVFSLSIGYALYNQVLNLEGTVAV